MEERKTLKGTVKIVDRKSVSIDGVNNIEGFERDEFGKQSYKGL